MNNYLTDWRTKGYGEIVLRVEANVDHMELWGRLEEPGGLCLFLLFMLLCYMSKLASLINYFINVLSYSKNMFAETLPIIFLYVYSLVFVSYSLLC